MHEGRVKKVLGNTDSVLSLAVNPTLSYYVTTHVQGVPLCLMVDTGAAVSLLRKDKWQLLGGADKYKLEQWTGSQLVGVEGSPVPVYGATCVKVQMGDLCVNIDFLVVDSLKVESLIGIDFLEKHRCVVNLEEGVLQLKGISIPLQNTRSSYKDRMAPAPLSLVETVPSRGEGKGVHYSGPRGTKGAPRSLRIIFFSNCVRRPFRLRSSTEFFTHCQSATVSLY